MTAFLKMHGLGNDFVVFDARRSPLTLSMAQVCAIADRRTGIGCDQVIVIETALQADATMRIFNADGSEVESCGNAARCVGALLLSEAQQSNIRLDTAGGQLVCMAARGGNIAVDMGVPRLNWRDIPLARDCDTQNLVLELDGQRLHARAVSMGNPHCVLFVDDAQGTAVAELGPRIEHHPLFPARTNVEFVQVMSRTLLRMRVWERGVGITRACGTGACASAVAAACAARCDRDLDIDLDGGRLHIHWREDDHVIMSGPVRHVFSGEIALEAMA
jgi:diaminopimelate epimerase